MEQSPSWEANIHLACQEIPRHLQNPNINFLVPTMNQINSAHALMSCSFKFHFKIIVLLTSMFPKWSVPFKVSD